MGMLGGKLEFRGLFCCCWLTAGLGREVVSLAVWGAAAGVWAEGLAAKAAFGLQRGQQVQLWLRSLQPGGEHTLSA